MIVITNLPFPLISFPFISFHDEFTSLQVSNLVSRELEAESIVVFDEAHNIDNVCIEALSVTLDRKALEESAKSVNLLQKRVSDMKASDSQRLAKEVRWDDVVEGGLDSTVLNYSFTIALHCTPLMSAIAIEMRCDGQHHVYCF